MSALQQTVHRLVRDPEFRRSVQAGDLAGLDPALTEEERGALLALRPVLLQRPQELMRMLSESSTLMIWRPSTASET